MTGLPLSEGQQGPEIADLRRRLNRWQRENDADQPLEAGDRFDETTAAVVRLFQRNRNLPADAEVGPETWQALVEANYVLGDRLLWQSGTVMRGDDVLDLQHRLNSLGFDAGMEDGLFNSAVRAAVMEFQGNVGLDVDGTVGARTLEALQRLHRGHQAAGAGTRVREERAFGRIARRGLIGLQIMVDPGTARTPPGATAVPGAAEVPWALASRFAGYLNGQGARTVISRGARQHPPISDRARMANRLGVDLVVSIGLNANQTVTATGAATYYFGSLRFVSTTGRALAENLLDATVASGLGPDCRAHPMTWAILRETRMPAVTIEPGFSTNQHDVQRLQDPAIQDALVHSWVDHLTAFLQGYSDA